jgi:hypothetical protein
MAGPALAGQAILEAVDNQLRGNNPPEARATYERLRAEGHSDEDARRLIARALATELWHVLKEGEPYHHARYAAKLRRLPEEPETGVQTA